MEVLIPRYQKLGEGFSRREKLKALEHPGRQTNPQRGYQSAVSWISDLIALRKVIILCDFCRAKFNPRRFGYRRVDALDNDGKVLAHSVNGQCDACKGDTRLIGGGTGFQPEELYAQTHQDPCEAKRTAKARAFQMGTYRFIQKELAKAVNEKRRQ